MRARLDELSLTDLPSIHLEEPPGLVLANRLKPDSDHVPPIGAETTLTHPGGIARESEKLAAGRGVPDAQPGIHRAEEEPAVGTVTQRRVSDPRAADVNANELRVT